MSRIFCASNCWGTFFVQMFGRYRLVPDGPFLEFFRIDYLEDVSECVKTTRRRSDTATNDDVTKPAPIPTLFMDAGFLP